MNCWFRQATALKAFRTSIDMSVANSILSKWLKKGHFQVFCQGSMNTDTPFFQHSCQSLKHHSLIMNHYHIYGKFGKQVFSHKFHWDHSTNFAVFATWVMWTTPLCNFEDTNYASKVRWYALSIDNEDQEKMHPVKRQDFMLHMQSHFHWDFYRL